MKRRFDFIIMIADNVGEVLHGMMTRYTKAGRAALERDAVPVSMHPAWATAQR